MKMHFLDKRMTMELGSQPLRNLLFFRTSTRVYASKGLPFPKESTLYRLTDLGPLIIMKKLC